MSDYFMFSLYYLAMYYSFGPRPPVSQMRPVVRLKRRKKNVRAVRRNLNTVKHLDGRRHPDYRDRKVA